MKPVVSPPPIPTPFLYYLQDPPPWDVPVRGNLNTMQVNIRPNLQPASSIKSHTG